MKPETLKLLFVLAHPDDETFGAGGTIALYTRRGVAVHLVCATRGEVGEAPPGYRGYASIAEMREAELKCAAEVLGLDAVHFLGYRDSGMAGSPDNSHPRALAAADTATVAREIARYLREFRPHVVVTFDPIGGYLHPDHIATHHATVRAFHLAADAREEIGGLPAHRAQKLYYLTFSRRFLRAVIRALRLFGRDPRKFGTNQDVDITKIAEHDFPIHATISVGSAADVKAKAIACHASQAAGFGGIGRLLQRMIAGSETYMRAIPETPPARMERDLFEGIK